VASLLERFKANPRETRRKPRVELGCCDEVAAEVYALMVFLCDGLLECKTKQIKGIKAKRTRFFEIACQLPIELQMILCYRVVDSMKDAIPGEMREAAFKDQAMRSQEIFIYN
jgi:hypothetical protein